MPQTVSPVVQIPAPWLSTQAHTRVYGKQVVPDTAPGGLDAPTKTRHSVFNKPCRITGVSSNQGRGVFRRCSWGLCGCRVTPTGRPPTCNAMRCSTRGLTRGSGRRASFRLASIYCTYSRTNCKYPCWPPRLFHLSTDLRIFLKHARMSPTVFSPSNGAWIRVTTSCRPSRSSHISLVR